MDVRFYDDPRAFLADAGGFLAADPVHCSVIASIAERYGRRGMPAGPFWFAAVIGPDGVAGAAMRTHPDPPHAGFVVAMPSEAVSALADALAARGETVAGWNGDLEAGRELCRRAVRGGAVQVVRHSRLFELGEVVWPRRPAGDLRAAVLADQELVADWMAAFHHDAEIQGGREPEARAHEIDRETVLAGIEDGRYWLWAVDGRPVHLSGSNPPAYGVVRIGPVYTPPEHRGKGYAGWVVALLSQRALDAGLRPCLYTDQANPVSNMVYERIGYQALGDEGELRAVTPASAP